jgi:hypothetical protein
MKTKILVWSMISCFLITSCNKEEEENSDITTAEIAANAKLDIANNDVSDIVEDLEAQTYSNSVSGRKSESSSSSLSTCATITRNPTFGTAITPGTVVTKTIDFGTVGCTLNNGNVVKGKITASFTFQPEATSHTINYSFDSFYHNGIKIDGDKSFTRVLSTGSNPHPIVTMNMDLTATFPNGDVYTRVGQRVREIIEGYSTASWTDNEYQVTGSWTTTGPNTTSQTSTITYPLIIKMSCAEPKKPLIVQGIITITRNNTTASLDYGNGDCDNLAVFTKNGISFNIVIGN